MNQKLALIGYGEAGHTFAAQGGWGKRACAFDLDSGRLAVMRSDGVQPALDAAVALCDSALALSLVTADQALAAAQAGAKYLDSQTLWCDMNSVAPQTKRAAAALIEAGGGRYVDVAVMAPVDPAGLAVPLLLSGSAAEAASIALNNIGFSNIRVVGEEVGRASAIKMIRSVMVKGVEALTAEMMAAAEAAGIVDEVLASLDSSNKSMPWKDRAAYNLERMTTHGNRRAAEMDEAAKTLTALGIDPIMTRGTIIKQAQLAAHPAIRNQAA